MQWRNEDVLFQDFLVVLLLLPAIRLYIMPICTVQYCVFTLTNPFSCCVLAGAVAEQKLSNFDMSAHCREMQ